MVTAKQIRDNNREKQTLHNKLINEIYSEIGEEKVIGCMFIDDMKFKLSAREFLSKEELNFILDKGFELVNLSDWTFNYIFHVGGVGDG